MQEMCVETPLQVQERHRNWVEEMRNREPSETDLHDIQQLRGQGYKPAAIACALELNKKTVNKILRKLQ